MIYDLVEFYPNLSFGNARIEPLADLLNDLFKRYYKF